MRLHSGQALYVVDLGHNVYCPNEHYQESTEYKGRNPICFILHFQTVAVNFLQLLDAKKFSVQ